MYHFIPNSGILRVIIKKSNDIRNKVVRRWYTPRRALLYVPGDDKRKLNKTLNLEVDCIAMDCEDGVALNRKNDARNIIREILDGGKPKKKKNYDWAVRVNSIDSGLCNEDLEQILRAKNVPDTILLPKIEDADQVRWFAEKTSCLVQSHLKFNLIMYIETANGFINLVDICKTATELQTANKFTPSALVFGSDDLCASLGVIRTEDSIEILYARQKLVLVAKAFGLQAIDMVYIQYKDLEGLKRQSEQGAKMGYTGKQVIHPDQVPVVQEAFLPTAKQIEWATGLLQAFNDHQKSGKGAFTYKGSMIDMPTMKQAQNIMNLVKYVQNERN